MVSLALARIGGPVRRLGEAPRPRVGRAAQRERQDDGQEELE